MKHQKRALLYSVISLLLSVTMLMGTTYAWFTDGVSSSSNIITAGNLDVEMYYTDDLESDNWKDATNTAVFSYDNWEPGYTEVRYIKIVNAGGLAFRYRMSITPEGVVGKLAEVIDLYYLERPTANIQGREALAQLNPVSTLREALINHSSTEGVLLPEGKQDANYDSGEIIVAVAMKMQEDAGNEYQNESIGDGFAIQLVATQFSYESDSFGDGYDNSATFPELELPAEIEATVTPTADGKVPAGGVQMQNKNGSIKVTVPAGALLKPGTKKLTATVTEMDESDANIVLGDNEILRSLDVHVEGLADGNTVPALITIEKALMTGLNLGNYQLYHVENGVSKPMTLVTADPDSHNDFTYDPVTGDVTLAMASFSEVAVVADTENPWEGKFDYTWYDASKTELQIANADQLAAFGAIVGGMKKVTARVDNKYTYSDEVIQDSFAGKTVKLIADVNLGDDEENNSDLIFYPIGYWNNEGTYERKPAEDRTDAVNSGLYSFEGTFDGNGHTIANFYHNTWEMKGDHNWYDATLQYYRDGMGLFGKVYGGTVKNLTVKNFSSDGEIATTGVIAAYADGATFENIAIFNCNPRVYNIGNGGIVGCVGWYAKEKDLKTTFKNITVDNSNKISALWGSYDVACGGIVGQYYPTSGQTSAGTPANGGVHFENCHIAAQMDVYNDVCANYQYYAYRYTGMLIGSVRENVTIDGHSYPKMDGITASGCTVHFGTWNDYYYCEIIDNTTASYTHDYQMSRLTEIKAIDGTTITYLDGATGTVPASGRANYVIVDYTKGHGTENATCYHFKDGAVWTHDMGGIQTGIDENGDGQDDLKEDKQHIYLEFNNLVTGYGWGVTTKGVGDLAGVTILDREVADSVNKFKPVIDNNKEFSTESTVKIGELFAAIESAGVAINSKNVQVTVSPFGATSTAGGTYVANTDDWTMGTLTFSGAGKAVISITDYYFCKTTTVEVIVIGTDKFGTNFVNYKNYLYRVGFQNAVALGTIFNGKDISNPASVVATIECVKGDVKGVFTKDTNDWTKGTIKFSGTGVVKVSIKDDASKEFVINLEVVDAYNVTQYSELKNQNSVLLNDITMSNNGQYSLFDYKTLYGNGFTFDVAAGRDSDTEGGYVGGNGTVWVRNSTLDNVKIVGEVYTKYGGTVTAEYNFPTVLVLGDSVIANSYISNGSSPVRVGSGCNIEIINSTLEGGIFANLDIRGGTVKLKDVVTINQSDKDGNSISNDKKIVGLGIVVYTGSTVTIDVDGLTQYNCISEKASFTGDAATLRNVIFGNNYKDYQFESEGVTWVNTGIISMVAEVGADNISEIDGYFGKAASIVGFNGYVYAPTDLTSVETPSSYKSSGQYQIAPTYKFDYTTKNNVPQVSGSNDYCYFDQSIGKYLISFDDGESFKWDANILSVTKGGKTLDFTVTVSGSAKVNADNTITFDTAGDYVVTYSYSDSVNYRLNGSTIQTFIAEYEKTVKITVYEVVDTSAKTEFAFGSNGFRTETANNLTYVMPNVNATVDSNTAGIGVTTVGGVNIYYPIVSMHKSGSSSWYNYFSVFESVTITDLDGTKYSNSTTELPSGLTVIGGFILDANGKVSTAESANGTGIFNYSTGKEIKCKTYSSYGLCYYPDSQFTKTGTSDRAEQTIVVKYRYTDSNGTPYYYYVGYWCEKHTKTTCVTPDTLVTLADGTQKRIDQVTYADQLLVWNFYTGAYDVVPSSIVMNHGYGNYTVVTLKFDDGTTINTINGHGFFDAATNKYVILNENNVVDYIGHSFVKVDGDGYSTVTLVDYSIKTEYTESWSVLTSEHYNCIMEGLWTITPAEVEGSAEWLMPYAIGDEMKYDEAAMQADIETYGLYTYEEFADLITYEQFVALGLENFKVSVGKGYITYEEILYLIELHCN